MSVCVDQLSPLIIMSPLGVVGGGGGGGGGSERVPIQCYFHLVLSAHRLFHSVFVKFESQQLEGKSGCSERLPCPSL